MKVHLNQIPAEGLHLEGEEKRDILALDPQEHIRTVGPVRYSLEVGLNGDGLWATGEVTVPVELACVRCLEPFTYPVRVEDVALQIERTQGETVDLTPHLREDILLALPAYPHCDWSGEKVCPQHFPVAETTAPPADVSTTATASPALTDHPLTDGTPPTAWEALDRLDLDRPAT